MHFATSKLQLPKRLQIKCLFFHTDTSIPVLPATTVAADKYQKCTALLGANGGAQTVTLDEIFAPLMFPQLSCYSCKMAEELCFGKSSFDNLDEGFFSNFLQICSPVRGSEPRPGETIWPLCETQKMTGSGWTQQEMRPSVYLDEAEDKHDQHADADYKYTVAPPSLKNMSSAVVAFNRTQSLFCCHRLLLMITESPAVLLWIKGEPEPFSRVQRASKHLLISWFMSLERGGDQTESASKDVELKRCFSAQPKGLSKNK